MNQEQYTTKKRKYAHLNLCERKEIERCFKAGYSIGAIARALGRHKSTISREIKRGSVIQRKAKYSKPIKKEHLENWLPYKELKSTLLKQAMRWQGQTSRIRVVNTNYSRTWNL